MIVTKQFIYSSYNYYNFCTSIANKSFCPANLRLNGANDVDEVAVNGSSITLTCDVAGATNYNWTKLGSCAPITTTSKTFTL